MKKKILFFLTMLIAVTMSAQDSISMDAMNNSIPEKQIVGSILKNGTKTDADSAFAQKDFLSAIGIYEQLLHTHGESAELYYNLGNAYFKADNIAKAILNYERALLLNPGDSDTKFNLEVAVNKTIDKVEPTSEVFFISWTKSLINCMSTDAWAKYGILTFILFIGTLYLFFFSKRILIKKFGFIASIVLLLLTIFINIFASKQKDRLGNRTEAIIMNPTVTVKSTPNESGTDLFILHEGRKVSIKDSSMKEWKEIKLEDGNVGWVPKSVIEII